MDFSGFINSWHPMFKALALGINVLSQSSASEGASTHSDSKSVCTYHPTLKRLLNWVVINLLRQDAFSLMGANVTILGQQTCNFQRTIAAEFFPAIRIWELI